MWRGIQFQGKIAWCRWQCLIRLMNSRRTEASFLVRATLQIGAATVACPDPKMLDCPVTKFTWLNQCFRDGNKLHSKIHYLRFGITPCQHRLFVFILPNYNWRSWSWQDITPAKGMYHWYLGSDLLLLLDFQVCVTSSEKHLSIKPAVNLGVVRPTRDPGQCQGYGCFWLLQAGQYEGWTRILQCVKV